ncbi:AfsR/SARP family transcriptional regulator [Actinoplanes sp. TRM 88003]|uniref:AfsR/SARP family transcriptional regulator n=1 Tax=Paractinoplanes aksuensis TaxID=2939490 RepID=A0ABT1DI62_9ACTN|nr:BTAD domain-containing putative transcriptional regulator [Actinoplanes aksuensis]MCO8270487.1 AfsR/SARP family transcriptional regulator [Actinoplanes aksuensis]
MGGDGDSATRLRVTLLGALRVSCGGAVVAIPGARVRALLVRLALAGGRPVDAGALVDAVWIDGRPGEPANALQSLVSRLRKMLGAAGAVVPVEGGYRLDVSPDDVDSLRFERLVAGGREKLRVGEPQAAVSLLVEALDLWLGPVAAEPATVAAVAPATATRLRRASVEAVADLAEAELALGQAGDAAARLTSLLAEEPVDERAAALLMDALAAQGRQAEALGVYESIRGILADRLGADPGTALRERHLRLLRSPSDLETAIPHSSTPGVTAAGRRTGAKPATAGPATPASAPAAATPAASAAAAPGRVTSAATAPGPATTAAAAHGPATAGSAVTPPTTAGPAEVAPGRSAGPTDTAPTTDPAGPARGAPGDRGGALPPSNLPAPLTSFVGRDDDLARIDTLLAAGRLVTIVGPGGAGKTRLSIEAGRRRRHEYRDGTWLIDLAAVTEPAKVGAALLTAVGLRGSALFELSARMQAQSAELDVLVEQLSGRECLLIADNCEHLIDAVAHLLAALLPRCPGLTVLATSREPLAVDGEALVPLGPLTLPTPGDDVGQVRRTASVRLFVERAAAVRPKFDVDEHTRDDIVRVVRGLDGLPLALELAAARLRTLSLAELTTGLSDRFRLLTTGHRTANPRHRTLRAVIAWSWDLLGADERVVAERVSVLPGGVTSATAAAVCSGTSVGPADIPDLLGALVDRSLLQLAPEPGRYRMLETLREYGTERLAEQSELNAVRGLAARHLAALIARLDPELRGHHQLRALRELSAEYDNALAALRHLCDVGDERGAVGLAMNLAWFWQMFGRHNDATYWLAEALAVPAVGPSLRRDCAEAFLLLNRVSARSAMTPEAVEKSEAELRALKDRLLSYPALPGLAGALTALTLFFLQEDEASLAVIDRLTTGSDVWLAGLAHLFRAQFAENDGDIEQVAVHVAAALKCFGNVGDRWGQATALPMRALLRQYDGDPEGALADLDQARTLARQFGSLNLNDELFIDLRWIDLHMRQGNEDQAIAMLISLRERALNAAAPEMIVLLNALEAGMWVRLGDLSRARELIDLAEAEMAADPLFAGDHGRAIAGSVRAALALELGDLAGAQRALTGAYTAAVESRDKPILALVAVTAAGLAERQEHPYEAARLLGAAARLRGAHDRSDPNIRTLTAKTRAALGEEGFARAYGTGFDLDGKSATVQVDPARLMELPEGQARRA